VLELFIDHPCSFGNFRHGNFYNVTVETFNCRFQFEWKFCKSCKDCSGGHKNIRPPTANVTDASLNSGLASNTANLGTVSRDMHVDRSQTPTTGFKSQSGRWRRSAEAAARVSFASRFVERLRLDAQPLGLGHQIVQLFTTLQNRLDRVVLKFIFYFYCLKSNWWFLFTKMILVSSSSSWILVMASASLGFWYLAR